MFKSSGLSQHEQWVTLHPGANTWGALIRIRRVYHQASSAIL